MENHSPKDFCKPPELRWDNPQSAGDFPRSEGRLSCYAPVHFCGGLPPLFPAIPNEMETQNSRLFAKGGSSIYNFEIAWKITAQGLSQTAWS